LIKKISEKEVGITITTIDDELRKKYEPYSSPVNERLAALKKLNGSGIPTWAFIGPIMPFFTEKNLPQFIKRIAATGTKRVIIDKLRIKKITWPPIERVLQEECAAYLEKYKKILFSPDGQRYFHDAEKKIMALCKEHNLDCERAF
jgi:DNA repair photolyase